MNVIRVFFFLTICFPRAYGVEIGSSPHPDCTEQPMSIDELDRLASSDKIKTMQDFLNAIPKSSMQDFTFVYNSLSLQRGNEHSDENGQGKVSPLWPRVLRSTMDGKITMSFVCDPKNPAYGKVEILHFDEETNELKSKELDFTQTPSRPNTRIHNNPESCVSCHAGAKIDGKQSLKYNWQDFWFWRDCDRTRGTSLYGGNKDTFNSEPRNVRAARSNRNPQGCTDEKDTLAGNAEKQDYKNFREIQKDNPCFASLPWLSGASANFPYEGNRSGSLDSTLINSPNFRKTLNYSRWTARRNLSLLKRSATDFEKLKYFIAMDGHNCVLSPEEIKKAGILLDRPLETRGYSPIRLDGYSYLRSGRTYPILDSFSKKAGLTNRDWALEFRRDDLSSFQSGIGTLQEIVGDMVHREIAKTNPNVQVEIQPPRTIMPGDILPTVLEQDFKQERFSCITKDLDMIRGSPNTCEALRTENNKHIAKYLGNQQQTCSNCGNPPSTPDQISRIESTQTHLTQVQIKLNQDSVARGKALVQPNSKGKCIMCHAMGVNSPLPAGFSHLSKEMRFIPNEKPNNNANIKESIKILKEGVQYGLLDSVREVLLQKKSMPPPEVGGANLTQQEREDIQAYIESLTR